MSQEDLRVLLVTNMYPVPSDAARGVFVARQVDAVNEILRHHVEVVLVGRTGAGGLYASRAAVGSAIARVQPHVLHVVYGLTGAALPFRLRAPLILTLCGSDVLQWAGGHRWRRGLPEFGISVLTAARACAITVQSSPVRDALPWPLRGKVTIKPMGVDLSAFRPMNQTQCRRALGWSDDETVVLFPADPGRPLKQWPLAQEAVRRLAREHGVSVRLASLGSVEPSAVPLYLNGSDCVLIVSGWEAGPIVLSEALACGVPVVSVPVGYAAARAELHPLMRVCPADATALATTLAALLADNPPRRCPETDLVVSQADYARYIVGLYQSAATA